MDKKIIILLSTTLFLSCGCLDQAIGQAEEIACDNVDPAQINEEWNQDHCFKDAALRKNDPSLCEKIKYNPPQTKCFMELAEKLGNPRLCHEMNPTDPAAYTQTQCLHQVAVKEKDPLICDMIGSGHYSNFIGVSYNREECYKALGLQYRDIQEIYKSDEKNFQYCYDIVHAHLHKSGPAARQGVVDSAQEKKQIYEDMIDSGFSEAAKGWVAEGSDGSTMNLRDGDIIFFADKDYPDPINAPHYAIVVDGRIWQVLNYKQGGYLDGPRDPAYFFSPRSGTNPYTGAQWSSPKVYHFYRVYRKR